MMALFTVLNFLLCFGAQADPVPETTTASAHLPFISLEKCFDDLGCFQNGAPFYHPVYRPISLLPNGDIHTKFWFYGPSNPSEKQELELTIQSLNGSDFDPQLRTKFIIHGYISFLVEGDYKHRMKDALLSEGQYNVILVDWTKKNKPPYAQAVANARVVAAQLANFIHFLMNNTDIQAESVHLIGHSLGAHISGWTGERVPNLGRISGLDPAGPYFHSAENIVRLDSGDAKFVDVIHTNGGTNFVNGFGTIEAIGHLDFYPNGGESQPGCIFRINANQTADKPQKRNIMDNVENLGLSNACGHSRSPELYIASIGNTTGNCRFESIACESWSHYKDENCRNASQSINDNPVKAEMGYYSKQIPGVIPGNKFYLKTTSLPPYCVAS